ncbi:serine hydrolase [Chitinophaga sp. CF418]|uniref:serine hydrolase domain-containing protein n=1 Tax=Chitinophaga sp. CF418 TaxID=1855287 RepID=UPI0009150D23|nr:serine hydrolase domain-containing protein [Chitinophaga sp. CF418]SHL96559.1 CubicO group peptidase, beta-lactamase class C family [Chitinophaga sp. CF418]
MNRLLTLSLLLFWQITLAQTHKQYQELISKSDEYFADKLASDHIVGVSAAIVIDGQVIWARGFGYSDRDRKVPMLPETVVNIGSVTKTFTSLAVMQLHEKGLLNINKRLNTYLPGFHPMSRPQYSANTVTIRSVITHTSGIQSDIWKNSDLESGKYTDVLRYINDTYLLYPAGAVALYSNAGYNVLGHLVKTVSKEDYADYVHKHIFLPLKMTSSGFAMDALKNRTKIYAYGQEFKEYELRDIASGGIYSNINDLAIYAIGMLDAYRGKSNALISQKTAQQMFALSNASVRIETNKKGLGWFEFRNNSTFAPYHAGSAGFAQAKLLLFPDKNAAVMVLTNTAEGGKAAEEFCFNMLPRFGLSVSDLFPSPINIPAATTTTVSLNKLILQAHVGSYASSVPYTTIRFDNGHLNMESAGNVTLLKPVSSNEYIPYTIKGADTVIKNIKQRYFFNDIGGYHYLIQSDKNREYNIGYRLRPIDTLAWKQRSGLYEQYGYQMLIGDSKFKSIEIYITPDQVLMCRLKTMGSSNEIPLDVIDSNHAMTTNLYSGFGGFTVTFHNEGAYQIVNFGGITFRK